MILLIIQTAKWPWNFWPSLIRQHDTEHPSQEPGHSDKLHLTNLNDTDFVRVDFHSTKLRGDEQGALLGDCQQSGNI